MIPEYFSVTESNNEIGSEGILRLIVNFEAYQQI